MHHGFLLWCDAGAEPHLDSAPTTDVARSEQLTVATIGAPSAADVAAEYRRSGTIGSPSGPAAAVVIDHGAGTVLAARDRTGLQPLFFATGANGFGVSSDARALGSRLVCRPSRTAVAAWLVGAPLEPWETLLDGMRRVPAGHLLELARGRDRLSQLWAPPAPGSRPAADAAEFGPRLEAAVARLVGGERAAILLSGGLDSTAVAAAAEAVAARHGGDPPFALSVDFPGASERTIQRLVASGLHLTSLEAELTADQSLLARGFDRIASSLWPTPAVWTPVFDDLIDSARAAGAAVLLDGQGGDDLLDAGVAGGRALLTQPMSFVRWAQAERRYTGSAAASVRAAFGSRFRPRAPTLPAWLTPDPELRGELLTRLAAAPRDYAAQRSRDTVDAVLAAQREETFDRGLATGIRHLHPLWDDAVVELLDGLPPAALVVGGNPKAPAREYLRARLAQPTGTWPRPALADAPLGALLRAGAEAAWQLTGGLRNLSELGILAGNPSSRDFQQGETVSTLSMDLWIQGLGERRPP